MRDLLTYIGIGLILLLTALLGAPLVVDFDAHRARFAEEISHVTGAQAVLGGPIAFRVLPTPYFSAAKLSLQGELGALKAEKAEFELSITALLGGRLNFTRAEFFHPAIELDAARLRRPSGAAQFEALTLHDARLRVTNAGAPLFTLDHLDFKGRIASIDGPYRGNGAFVLGERKISYSLASDLFAKAKLPLRLKLTGEAGEFDLDGALDLSGAPMVSGKASAQGAAAPGYAPGPWRLEGDLTAQADAIKLDKATANLGEGALAAKFSGNLLYGVANGAVTADFSAPHLDGVWAENLAGLVAQGAEAGAQTRLRLKIDSLDWRGGWRAVKLARDPGSPLHIEANGAGAARVEARVAPKAGQWRGDGSFSARDFQAFAAATGAPPLPFHQVSGAGVFSFSADELAVSAGKYGFDRAQFSGDLVLKKSGIAAKLTGTDLDPSSIKDYLAVVGGDNDLDLSLDAQTLPKGDGKLLLRLVREKGASRLEKLEWKNIFGAEGAASGESKNSEIKGSARVKAGDLTEFAGLVARLAPGEVTQWLARHAKVLSPAALNFKAGDHGYALDGQAAATRFSAALDNKGAVTLDVSAPEAADLLGQIGAPPVLSPQKLGPAQVSLKTEGDKLVGKAQLGRLQGEFSGARNEGGVEGRLLLAGDPSSLIGGPAGEGKIAAGVEAREGQIVLRDLAGARGEAHFSGQVALSSEGVTGELDVDKFSAPAFLALTLGTPAPVKKGALWPSLSFAPVLADPPHTHLTIRAGEVAPFGLAAQFDLTLAPDALSVAKIDAPVAGGTLRGGFELRRKAGQAVLTGEISGEGIALKNPALAATLEGHLKFGGSGANMATLVGSLAGSGSAKVSGLAVSSDTPDAPAEVLAAQAATEAPFNANQTIRDLDAALAKGDLRIGDGATPLRLAEGKLKAARDAVSFTYDLNDLTFSLDSTLPTGRVDLTWLGAWSAPARKLDAASFVTLAATKALEREQARIARQRELDRQHKAELEKQKREEEARRKQEELQRKLDEARRKQEERERMLQQQAPAPAAQ